MGDFSFGEMLVVAIIAILIYGKDLPTAARKLASLYTKFRRQIADIKDDIQRQIPPEEFKLDSPSSYTSEKPSTPTGVSASLCGSYMLLTWNSSVGASSYTVRRARGPDEPLSILCSGLPELSYSDYDVSAGTRYRYVVYASNSTGDSADSEEASEEYPAEGPSTPPAEPSVAAPAEASPPAAAAPVEPTAATPPEAAAPPMSSAPPEASSTNGNGHAPEAPPANGNGRADDPAAQASPPPLPSEASAKEGLPSEAPAVGGAKEGPPGAP